MSSPIIMVAGFKNSGKTTLIENLVKDIVSIGRKVAVVKHVYHSDFEVDHEGKDTWRFTKSGAQCVVAISRGRLFH